MKTFKELFTEAYVDRQMFKPVKGGKFASDGKNHSYSIEITKDELIISCAKHMLSTWKVISTIPFSLNGLKKELDNLGKNKEYDDIPFVNDHILQLINNQHKNI